MHGAKVKTSNKSERLMHLIGWFIWMYDDARTCNP